jgi:hypothetical protein
MVAAHSRWTEARAAHTAPETVRSATKPTTAATAAATVAAAALCQRRLRRERHDEEEAQRSQNILYAERARHIEHLIPRDADVAIAMPGRRAHESLLKPDFSCGGEASTPNRLCAVDQTCVAVRTHG